MEENDLTHTALVSIIIPVFNSEKYLTECIDSALAQTWPFIEVIVVDDGSTDTSPKILESYSNKIKILRQINKCASAARNLGLSWAKGDYIQFLDADDLLSADKIEKQVTAIRYENEKVAVCNTIHFFEESKRLFATPSPMEDHYIYSTDDSVKFMINLWGGNDFKGWMVQTNAWLIPRSLIDKFGVWNEKLTLDDDGEFFARIVLNSQGIVKTGGINYYRKYQFSKHNLSSERTKKGLESILTATLLKRDYLFRKNDGEFAKRAIHRLLTGLLVNIYLSDSHYRRIIETELKKLPKFKYEIIIGGPVLNTIANFIGWRTAKRMQHLHATIFNKE